MTKRVNTEGAHRCLRVALGPLRGVTLIALRFAKLEESIFLPTERLEG